jgi:hypothetical protein
LIRIREVLGSNLGYSERSWGFSRFFLLSQANPGMVPRLGHGRLHPNLFQIIMHLLSLHTALYNLAAESVIK